MPIPISFFPTNCTGRCRHIMFFQNAHIGVSAHHTVRNVHIWLIGIFHYFCMHPDTIVYWESWTRSEAFPPLTHLTEWVIKGVKIWFNCFGHGWKVAMVTCCSSVQGSGWPTWLFQGRYRLLEIKANENIYLGPIFICSKNVKSLCQNFDQISE